MPETKPLTDMTDTEILGAYTDLMSVRDKVDSRLEKIAEVYTNGLTKYDGDYQ